MHDKPKPSKVSIQVDKVGACTGGTAGLTVTVATAVAEAKLPLPVKFEVSVCVPTDSVDTLNVATPEALSALLPNVVAPSRNVTVPVGTVAAGETAPIDAPTVEAMETGRGAAEPDLTAPAFVGAGALTLTVAVKSKDWPESRVEGVATRLIAVPAALTAWVKDELDATVFVSPP